jgi:hypothetical protein
MVLSNAEKQARWREKHIERRHRAQRIVNLLVRKTLTDEHVEQVANLLGGFFSRHGVRVLRRRLKALADPSAKDREEAKKRNADYWRENERQWQAMWLREHPGRTRSEYNRLLNDDRGEVWKWRRAKGTASLAAKRRDWERDHPGEEWQEHMCGMTDREYTDYLRWEQQRARKRKIA